MSLPDDDPRRPYAEALADALAPSRSRLGAVAARLLELMEEKALDSPLRDVTSAYKAVHLALLDGTRATTSAPAAITNEEMIRRLSESE